MTDLKNITAWLHWKRIELKKFPLTTDLEWLESETEFVNTINLMIQELTQLREANEDSLSRIECKDDIIKKLKEAVREAKKLIEGLSQSDAWQDCDEHANEWLERFGKIVEGE